VRTAFIRALTCLAERDPSVWLLTGDMGFSVLESFAARFPDRFVNAGVAEQGMTGIAAGLALAGKTVFTYSIANFPVLRCLEQIRNDLCHHRLRVRIVSVGGGFSYGSQGYTHHGLEDLAVTSALPGMTVLAPGDPVETALAVDALDGLDGPAYLRLGRAGEAVVHESNPRFRIGKAIGVREGSDVTLVSTGGILPVVVAASRILACRGCRAGVLSMHTLRPLDEEAIVAAARATGRLVTVEEHGKGGLAPAVAEVLARQGGSVRFAAVRADAEPAPYTGSQDRLRAACGLSPEAVAAVASGLLEPGFPVRP
jgi:transketolase